MVISLNFKDPKPLYRRNIYESSWQATMRILSMLQAGKIDSSLAMALLEQITPPKPQGEVPGAHDAHDAQNGQGVKRPLEAEQAEAVEGTVQAVEEVLADAKKAKLDARMD